MYLRTKSEKRKISRLVRGKIVNSICTKQFLILECDKCGTIFEDSYRKRLLIKKYHFCSRECVYASAIVKDKTKQTNIVKYGVENPMQCEEIQNKVSKTYHLKTNSEKDDIQKKRENTMVDRYGVKYTMENATFVKMAQETNLKNHGCICTLQSPEVKILAEKSMMDHYGVKFPMQSSILVEKIQGTLFDRHGVKCGCLVSDSDGIEKRVKTCLEKYGVPYPAQNEEIHKKVVATLKERGWFKNKQSASEDWYYEYLCTMYSKNNIDRQILIAGWVIDFYVKPINAWIEFRGDWWHGKNYTYEELIELAEQQEEKMGKKSCYRSIAETKLRDIIKETFFRDNNMKLYVVWESNFLVAF